jgi:hypothetical protein
MSKDENGVIPFLLSPHSSHLLQPLDVGCFSPMKNCFNSLAPTNMKEHPAEIQIDTVFLH